MNLWRIFFECKVAHLQLADKNNHDFMNTEEIDF